MPPKRQVPKGPTAREASFSQASAICKARNERMLTLAAAFKRGGRFVDEFLADRRDGFLAGHQADRLAGHDRTAFDVPVDHRAAQRARPIMLDLELGLAHFDGAVVELLGDLALLRGEVHHLLVLERADWDDRQARVDLDARNGIPRRGAEESFLEVRVGDAFVRADEPRAELNPDRSHFEIGGDRFAAADATGDEYGDI